MERRDLGKERCCFSDLKKDRTWREEIWGKKGVVFLI
jgi:hypothetical protein